MKWMINSKLKFSNSTLTLTTTYAKNAKKHEIYVKSHQGKMSKYQKYVIYV